MTAPALVTLHVWHVPTGRVAAAAGRVALDRALVARGADRPVFATLLGTADGRTFSPRDADLHTWAMVATWPDAAAPDRFATRHPTGRGWARIADAAGRIDLTPLASRGRWRGRDPFGPVAGPAAPTSYDGPVAAITRARLRWRTAPVFWRAVPAVAADVRRAAGLRWSLGIGEAPLGYQGTVSVWDSPARMHAFGAAPAHRSAVRRTTELGWYAEELFATFALVAAHGSLAGVGGGS